MMGTEKRRVSSRRSLAVCVAGAFLLLLLGGGCGHPAGTACQITGSGFTASHDCATKCLSRWTVNCPDGTRVTPAVCAGASGCEPGGCPSGQVCYHFDDPFDVVSYCIPDDVCGELTGAATHQGWEQDSKQAAAALRARYDARRQRRESVLEPTAPAAPAAEPPATEPSGTGPPGSEPSGTEPPGTEPAPAPAQSRAREQPKTPARSGAPALDFHTSPACWDRPRLFHTGPPPAEFANRLHFIEAPAIDLPGEPLASPDGTARLWLRQPDTSRPPPWGAGLVIDRGAARHRTLLVENVGAPLAPRWLNERWIFLRLTWGRTQFSDIIIDARTGELRYHEQVLDGSIAFEQFQAACRGRCPCDLDAAVDPDHPSRFTLEAEPPAARAGDQAMIGLLTLPAVFGPAQTGGVVPAARPRPVPIYAAPDDQTEPLAALAGLADFEYREYTYEGAAAVVYAKRPGWYAIGIHGQALPRGWVRAKDAGAFLPLAGLLAGGLAYLNAHWDGHLWAEPAGTRRTAEPSVLVGPGPRDASTEIPVNVLATRVVGDGLWLRIETLDESPCNSAAQAVVDRGWIPAYAATGDLAAGYYSRGC